MSAIRVLILCLFVCVPFVCGAATSAKPQSEVTVMLDFRASRSERSILEMQREAEVILKSAGYQINWVVLGSAPRAIYDDLVVLTFRGACELADAPSSTGKAGPLGITHISNGVVLPFGEVECDRVVNFVRPVIAGEDYAAAQRLVGRALGRVVAHELVHMLTRSTAHAHDGVEKPALSGQQLIEDYLPLSAFDIGRLRQESGGL